MSKAQYYEDQRKELENLIDDLATRSCKMDILGGQIFRLINISKSLASQVDEANELTKSLRVHAGKARADAKALREVVTELIRWEDGFCIDLHDVLWKARAALAATSTKE